MKTKIIGKTNNRKSKQAIEDMLFEIQDYIGISKSINKAPNK